MLEIVKLILGPVLTNTYIVADSKRGKAVVIDPADQGELILAEVHKRGWSVEVVWLTHAHFDHLGGVSALFSEKHSSIMVALHPADLPLWKTQGGAQLFGLRIDPGPEPNLLLQHGQFLHVGDYEFEVRHTPGHTPGHVVFYNPQSQVLFCGDVIFRAGIGRTDLPGGDYDLLMNSIRSQVLTLPDTTRLLSGHGQESTVGWERVNNPFLIRIG